MIFGALLWPREHEPEYNGIPLSGWLKADENYHSAILGIPHNVLPYPQYPADGSKSDVAIRQIGTNALPFLVRWIQYKTPLWRRCLIGSIRYWPDRFLKSRWTGRLYKEDAKAEGYADSAVFAFAVLGPTAKSALPELHRLAQSADSDTSRRALTCIDAITNPIVFHILPQN